MDVYSRRGSFRGDGLHHLSRHDGGEVSLGVLRSELFEPKELRFEASNFYYEALRGVIETHEKEVKHD